MLVIRMQRVGRKKLPQYRVVLQDSRSHPSSGKVITYLGSYNPHTKEAILKQDDIKKYLSCGAQPSDRVISLFQKNKIDLPSWAKVPSTNKTRSIRNPEKLRKNQPDSETTTEQVAEESTEGADATESTEATTELVEA